MNFRPSSLSLQFVFLAGLTLIYCKWLSSHHPTFPLNGRLKDCSTISYVITERWPLARKCRDVFEQVKEAGYGCHCGCRPASDREAHISRTVLDLSGGELEQLIMRNASQDLDQMIGDTIGNMISDSGIVGGGGLAAVDFGDLGPGE
jgi:hypothetical protein